MTKTIIYNINELVTCSGFSSKHKEEMNDLHIKYDSAIYIEDEIIKDIDSESIIFSKYMKDDIILIDANKKCVLPGFIDSHTHLVFGGYRENEFYQRINGATYMEIMEKGGGIINSVNATRKATAQELIDKSLIVLKSMLSYGVTTIEAKSGYGLDLDNEIKQLEVAKDLEKLQPIEIISTYLGAHAYINTDNMSKNEYISFMGKVVLPVIKERNLARFVDAFVEKNVYSIDEGRKILTDAKKLGFKIKIHADELSCLEGSKLAAELKCVSADHLLYASDEGINCLANNNVITTLLPLTAFNLKENYANGRKFIDKGCSVCIATDFNPGSCFSENINLAILLSNLYMGLTIEEAITAVTINAAAALSLEKSIGSIDVGKQADIIILDYDSYKFIPYHLGSSSVNRVIKKGKIVFSKENK